MENLKVSSKSDPKAVAGAIAKQFESGAQTVELHMIGAAAVNQAAKSTAIANSYVAASGFSLITTIGFLTVDVAGEDRTGIRFIVSKR